MGGAVWDTVAVTSLFIVWLGRCLAVNLPHAAEIFDRFETALKVPHKGKLDMS